LEADWEFEVAPDAPVIDAAWAGCVDLRACPELAARLPEATTLPALVDALKWLNAAGSPVWTSKCDVWEPDAFDPDELDATQNAAGRALACYIDLVSSEDAWSTLDGIADWCRKLCAALRAKPLRQCRADLVIRRSFVMVSETGLGVTAYVTGCGATDEAAVKALGEGLMVLARAIVGREE
jgi:hypothetical protein